MARRYAVHRTRSRWDGETGKTEVSVRGQVQLLYASIVKQGEDDLAHYCAKGYLRDGKATNDIDPVTARTRRLQGGEMVDLGDVQATSDWFVTGRAQRLLNALEIPHKIDLARMRLS